MAPGRLSRELVRATPLLRRSNTVGVAVEKICESTLPALPVVNDDGSRREPPAA